MNNNPPVLGLISLILSLIAIFSNSILVCIISIILGLLSEKHIYARIGIIISSIYLLFLLIIFFGIMSLMMVH